jgi:predicted NAD-dependent protein-ADP-ribosyltransferase YbiA (DUF1768 family)
MTSVACYSIETLSHFAIFYGQDRPIQLKGKQWRSVYCYYQAQKFADTRWEEKIRTSVDVGIMVIKAMVRVDNLEKNCPWKRAGEWDKVKEGVMMDALRAKFTQHQDLLQLLLMSTHHDVSSLVTGDLDSTLGITLTKTCLSACLEKVREEIRASLTIKIKLKHVRAASTE